MRTDRSLAAILAVCALPAASARGAGYCVAYDSGVQVGTISAPALDEVSGLAASQINPGTFWAIADSGSPAYVYALDAQGNVQDTLFVSGAANVDWEDLAVGPCPEACACLYIADIGDPSQGRNGGTVYRVSEPVPGETDQVTAAAVALSFAYPDGAHDAETLLVDPRDGAVYVVTKEDDGHNLVYRLPASAPGSAPVVLERVAEAVLYGEDDRARRATSGAVAPDGGRLVVRSEKVIQEYLVPEGAPLEAAFASTPLLLSAPEATQGEGISYSADGTRLVLDSERVPSPVYAMTCIEGEPATAPPASLTARCPDATESGPVYGCGGCVLAPMPAPSPGRRGLFPFALLCAAMGRLRLARRVPRDVRR